MGSLFDNVVDGCGHIISRKTRSERRPVASARYALALHPFTGPQQVTRSVNPSRSVQPKVVVILDPPSQAARREDVEDTRELLIMVESVEGGREESIEERSSAFHIGSVVTKF